MALFCAINSYSMKEDSKKRNRDKYGQKIDKEEEITNEPKLKKHKPDHLSNEIYDEGNFEYFEALPAELRHKIIATILEENIDKWDDIFNFDRNSLKEVLDEITLVSKYFNVFKKEELKNFIRSLRQNRLAYLEEMIKERYKDLSKQDLNKKLRNLLNPSTTKEGLEESVRLIIAGADIETKDNGGWAALMYAARNGHVEIARLLIDKGAAIDIKDSDGLAALMWAASGGQIEIVRLLIYKGAAIDIQDNDGSTALTLASGRRQKEIVSLLSRKDKAGSASWCTLQ